MPPPWIGCGRRTPPSRRRSGAAGEAHVQPVPAADATGAPGLDVSGLAGVIEVDPRRADRRRAGHVHLRGPGRRDAAARPDPATSCPQLRTITLGGAVTGLGIESTSLPQRAARTSRCWRWTSSPAPARSSPHARPGDADLFDTFPNSYGSLGYATRLRIELEPVARPGRAAARAVRRPRRCSPRRSRDRGRRRVGRRARRRHRRRRLRAGGVLPDAGPLGRRDAAADAPATTPASRSSTARSSERETDLLTHATTTCGAGTPTGSGAPARSAPSTRVVRRLWPRRWRRSDVYHRLVGLDRRLRRSPTGSTAGAGRPERERVIQDVELRSTGWPSSSPGSTTRSGCGRCGCARCAATRDWPLYPLDPGATYVNVGFWGTVHVGPDAADAPRNRAIEAKVHELGGHKSLYSEAFYDRGDLRRSSTTAPTSPG